MSSAYPDDIEIEMVTEEKPITDQDKKDLLEKADDYLDEISSSSSSDESDEIETTMVPVRYVKTDKVVLDTDVYQLTIAALISKNVGVEEYLYSLRRCIFCFIFQTLIAIHFGLEYISFDQFSLNSVSFSNNMIRLIASILF